MSSSDESKSKSPSSTPLLRNFFYRELQRHRVEAVPQAGWAWAVREHVAEVAAAPSADDLVANHAVAGVAVNADVLRVERCIEARPAGARLELGSRPEEWQIAESAVVHAGLLFGEQPTAEGRFGPLLKQHPSLLGAERCGKSLPFVGGWWCEVVTGRRCPGSIGGSHERTT